MKKFLLALIITCAFFSANATHTKGGWMYYEYLGPGISNPTFLRYKIGLNYYIDCHSNLIENVFNFSIYNAVSPFNFIRDESVFVGTIDSIQNCASITCYPCISNIASIILCYKIINYEIIVELPASPGGYTIAKQRCCRIDNISNLTPPTNNIGETYTISIPGVVAGVSTAHMNASPIFSFNDTSIVCANNFFSLNFSATDADGDSLVYSFCDAFNGGSTMNSNPSTASQPPFASVPYNFPFSGSNPLGAAASINPVTGVISGIAPDSGEYVVTICVDEYRNGIRFAQARKELHLKVAPCNPVKATMDPNFLTCGDLTLSFFNQTDNPAIITWSWNFGDPASGANDSSNLQTPNHTFSAAGVYTVKLIVNRGLSCLDSTTQQVSVYPGFFSGFTSNAPFCVGQPVQFTDTTLTNYGTVNNWSWNFGDPATSADTSHIKNPSYTYTQAGNYTVKLVSGNSLGCRDSATRNITILVPPVLNLLSKDSTYCGRDSLQLSASGTGGFSWSPVGNIIGANTATPTVFPTTPTTYQVILNNQGCTSKDSVRLTPLFDLSNSVTATPAAVCEGDTVSLKGFSNKTQGLSWQWTPAATLQTAASQNTQAYPVATTTYTLRTTWGKNCIVSKNISVPVTPLAIPNAGPDTSICEGQTSVRLLASGGNSYSWTPTTGLSNPNVANPVANPSSTTTYIVQVGVNGCSKTRPDTVLVIVRQSEPVDLINDTLICVIDTLQLNVPQQGSYLWSPNYMISNTTVANPKVSPDVPTLYKLKYTSVFGCITNDSVFVNVKAQVTLNAGNDTTICLNDGFLLRTSGDALTYNWTPATYLDNDSIKNPFSKPLQSTTYTVTGNIGKCQAQSTVTVNVVPPPVANAGPDAAVCFGNDIQLSATGGSKYNWSPGIFLSNTQIANPVVQRPLVNRQYIVSITDTLGCPKVITDTVIITVIPLLRVDAGPSDTSIVEDEVLLLNATGALNYQWSPVTWLNNAAISKPVARPLSGITYTVTGTDANGCIGSDSIRVRIFKIDPDMYVPTAFTPNGDGLNDLARPIMIGMKSLTYFKIFNRFGELVYSTSEIGKGWDGVYKGKAQATATFVWVAEGVTYKNQVRKMKGNLVLIR